MNEFPLSSEQVVALKALHKRQRDRKKADRVKAVVLLGAGWSVPQVAEALLVDATTVRLWRDLYQQGGEEKLLTLLYKGAEAKLTDAELAELSQHLDDNTYLDSNAIRDYIEKKYNVEYKPSGVKDLLARLGFVYKKPKHVPGKLDPEAQKAFVAEYEELLKTKGKNDPVYFVDATHPQHNSIPAYGWIRRGKEKLLKSNGGRKRVNIHGGVNIHSLDIVTDFAKSINKESSLRLLRKIEKKHPKAKKIHVWLDNASYYKAHWLRDELKGSKIVLHSVSRSRLIFLFTSPLHFIILLSSSIVSSI